MRRLPIAVLGVVLAAVGVPTAAAQDSRTKLLNTAFGDDVPSYGDSGAQVTKLQLFLNAQRRSHSLSPIAVDGHFGPTTLAALRKYESGVTPPTPPPAPTAANTDRAPAPSHAPPSGGVLAHGTGYYPANTTMEGGSKDRVGNRLYTLQQYLAGKAPYVSVAMDKNAFPYGTKIRIPELEREYGRDIDFRVVDTGDAFIGKGTSRIDICTSGAKASMNPAINGPLHIVRRSIGIVGALSGGQ